MTRADDQSEKLDRIDIAVALLVKGQIDLVQATSDLTLAINGAPDNGRHPGLKGRVGSLEQSRQTARKSIRGLWAVVVAMFGAVVTWLFSQWR